MAVPETGRGNCFGARGGVTKGPWQEGDYIFFAYLLVTSEF